MCYDVPCRVNENDCPCHRCCQCGMYANGLIYPNRLVQRLEFMFDMVADDVYEYGNTNDNNYEYEYFEIEAQLIVIDGIDYFVNSNKTLYNNDGDIVGSYENNVMVLDGGRENNRVELQSNQRWIFESIIPLDNTTYSLIFKLRV
jgi:hypothetical protein